MHDEVMARRRAAAQAGFLNDPDTALAALDDGEGVIPLFILDEGVASRAGANRNANMVNSLESLNQSLGGNLHECIGAC
ncbi:MAG: hypothetical protein EBY65_09305 [Acidimicrobiia bacterium]|nr:hypothetical protein [Acidimicrobiia bacterium]